MTSADCNAPRTAAKVSSSGSPGPAPTSVTETVLDAVPKPFTPAMKRAKSPWVGSLADSSPHGR